MQAFYADQFVLPLPTGHRFPMAKYQILRDRLRAELPAVRMGQALRASARGKELSIERQSLKPTIPAVIITSPTGKTQSVTLAGAEPGLSRAQVTVEEFGLYKLSDGELSTLVNVGPENPREFQDVVSTSDLLKPLAQATGGTVRRISAGAGDAITLPRFRPVAELPA